uniref:tRNA (uracil(54)-C(5))-methyltransferase n=1 Tax=Lygus hesperus TaxID=30085 RepID=A0A0A9W885_LYGHE
MLSASPAVHSSTRTTSPHSSTAPPHTPTSTTGFHCPVVSQSPVTSALKPAHTSVRGCVENASKSTVSTPPHAPHLRSGEHLPHSAHSGSPGTGCAKTPARTPSADPSLRYIHNPTATPTLRSALNWYRKLERGSDSCPKPPVHLSSTTQWRCHVKIPVRRYVHFDGSESTVMGLFAPNSHTVVPGIESCPTHHAAINQALALVASAISKANILGYCDSDGSGNLRYVCCTCAAAPAPSGFAASLPTLQRDLNPVFDTQVPVGAVQLVLVWNAAGSDAEKPSTFNTPSIPAPLPTHSAGLKYLRKSIPQLHNLTQILLESNTPLWHSIYIHYNNAWSHTNSIYSHDPNAWQLLHGPAALAEFLPTSSHTTSLTRIAPTLYFTPNVFHQSNLTGFTAIVRAVQNALPKPARILELYGGVGTIALHLLPYSKVLVCSDSNPYAAQCFFTSLATLAHTHPQALLNRIVHYCTHDAVHMVQSRQALHTQIISPADTIHPTHLSHLPTLHRIVCNPHGCSHPTKKTKKNTKKFHFNTCIVDPPRKGLDLPVLRALVGAPDTLTHVFYISCGFTSLTKDLAVLCSHTLSNPWRLTHVEFHVLFPGTDHIETLAILQR